MENRGINNQLSTVFLKFSLNYCKIMLFINFVVFLINTIKRYGLPSFEESSVPYFSVFIMRLTQTGIFIFLYIIVKKCYKCKAAISLFFTIYPILIFEFNYIILSYAESYILYILFYNSFRQIMLICNTFKMNMVYEVASIIYLIVRAITIKLFNPDFSFLSFIIYLFVYIGVNIPVIENYLDIRNTIFEFEQLKNDLESIVLSLPIPVFRFSINPYQINLQNKDFSDLVQSHNFTTSQEFLTYLFTDHVFTKYFESSTTGQYSIKMNNKEYNLKYKKLEQSKGMYYIACLEDLSKTKEMEFLKAREAYKQMFISAINHQLRTPLNGIYYPLTMIKENIKREDAQELLDLSLSSVSILNSLIDDTIAFSECEEGKMKLQLQSADIPIEIGNIKRIYDFESRQKGVDFSMNLSLKHMTVITDIKKVTQIIMILLSNAFKYTFKGSVTLECSENNNLLTIVVKDTGIGIKSNYLPTIFNEFSLVEEHNSNKLTSTGFQLSLVKKLVTLLNGTIEVESALGVGTTFTFKLKIERLLADTVNSFSTADELHKIPISCSKMNRMTDKFDTILKKKELFSNEKCVLIVDDNMSNVYVLQKMLDNLKVKNDKALNGQECVDKMARNHSRFNLILMDINMPVLNGFEATMQLRKLQLEGSIELCPIVAVTAQNETEIVDQCHNLGMYKCLFKPIKFQELKELIGELKIINPL